MLSITMKDPRALVANPMNARTHAKRQIRQIANSIQEFGFLVPILIDHNHMIIAGHGRNEAAKLLALAEVPTLAVDHLSLEQIRAYVIADNKLAQNAGWDSELLALALKELQTAGIDTSVTGFDAAELDSLTLKVLSSDLDDEEQVVEVDRSSPAVSQFGDLWEIEEHRLLCGDATKPDSYIRLLGDQKAHVVFTDPPYNVPIAGHVSGLGKNKHREFAMASGEMTSGEFMSFLDNVFANLNASSVENAIHYVCMDWRHMSEILAAGRKNYPQLVNLCVWAKTNGGMGSLYRSQHELIFVFKNGNGSHINNVQLGRHGRNRTNLWTYPGVNTFSKNRDADLAAHPTVKPVRMIADALLDCSQQGQIVLDPFSGSGATISAAHRTKRRAFAMELDPHYVDAALQRVEAATGKKARLSGTNETIHQVKQRRNRNGDEE